MFTGGDTAIEITSGAAVAGGAVAVVVVVASERVLSPCTTKVVLGGSFGTDGLPVGPK